MVQLPAFDRAQPLGQRLLGPFQQGVALEQQALHVHGIDALPGLFAGETFLFKHREDVEGDARARLAHAHDDVAFILETALLDAHGGHQSCQGC